MSASAGESDHELVVVGQRQAQLHVEREDVVAIDVALLEAAWKYVGDGIEIAILVQRQRAGELTALRAVVHHVAQAGVELDPVGQGPLQRELADQQQVEPTILVGGRQRAAATAAAHARSIQR